MHINLCAIINNCVPIKNYEKKNGISTTLIMMHNKPNKISLLHLT